MGDGSLSQDEIDALLQGADDMLSSPAAPTPESSRGGGGGVSPNEQNAIRESLGNAIMSAVGPLSGYLGGKTLSISNPFIEVKSAEVVRGDFPGQYIQVSLDYTGGLSGRNLMVFNAKDAGSISSLMMGDESGAAPMEMSDAHKSTIQEFTNQLLSSMATHLANTVGAPISTTPAVLSMARRGAELQLPMGPTVVKVTYDFQIQGILNSKLYHIMDMGLAQGFAGGMGMTAQSSGQSQAYHHGGPSVGISPVKFPPLDEGIPAGVGGNISLILDVPMTLTVELGRTTQLVQDILGLGEGSIIELDKLAGEPVDLLVNGKLIAKGEVVVIDENFGVRVTDIVSPVERMSGVQ